jgi:hypothetical protein
MEEPSGPRLETPVIEFEAEAPPMPQSAPVGAPSPVDSGPAVITSAAPQRVATPFPPASDLASGSVAPPAEEPSAPAITMEADLPPTRARPASLPSLPPLTPGGSRTQRERGKTVPPSAATPPPAQAPVAPPAASRVSIEAAVDAALRDLDDQEPTAVVNAPPRPPHLE